MEKRILLITSPESVGELEALQKAHVEQYTRKDGTVVQAHEDKRVAKPKAGGYVAPKHGEVGHHEHAEYGAYFRPGDKVRDRYGKEHEVAEHRGPEVRTTKGEHFHPTKLAHVSSKADGGKPSGGDTSPQERRHINRKSNELKAYHKQDAKSLKSSLGSALSSGDTEMDNGKAMTYGHVKAHLQTMRSQLGNDPAHKDHLEHAQYALNQSFRDDGAALSDKHAKLIGAALSGKTKMDDNGMIRHRAD